VIRIGDHLVGGGGPITYFGWSEDSMFPEVEQFDSLQNRIEQLLSAVSMTAERTAFLAEQQAQLQVAQAQLFQVEAAELQAQQEAELLARHAETAKGKPRGFKPPV
jgi:hypothetical protein